MLNNPSVSCADSSPTRGAFGANNNLKQVAKLEFDVAERSLFMEERELIRALQDLQQMRVMVERLDVALSVLPVMIECWGSSRIC